MSPNQKGMALTFRFIPSDSAQVRLVGEIGQQIEADQKTNLRRSKLRQGEL